MDDFELKISLSYVGDGHYFAEVEYNGSRHCAARETISAALGACGESLERAMVYASWKDMVDRSQNYQDEEDPSIPF